MSERARRYGKSLELFVFVTLIIAGPLAAIVTVSPPVRAGLCDQVGGVITGDWTITTTQVCKGIVYTVDGTVNINGPGSLTLINGGLRFAKDASHRGYALNVNAGGELILNNSVVTTQTNAIAPYVKLAFTVSGANSRFTMMNGSVLKFPGWFNATGATIEISKSVITGFTSTDLNGLGLYQDDNDDSPVITWSSTIAGMYRSRIERIYENASASGVGNASGIISGNVTLLALSNLYAYDSYIGADFSNVVGLHNRLQVDGSSNAYLYGVEIDRTQDPVAKTDWQPAFVPLAAGGSVFLFRWLRLTAVDSTAFPVSGATVWSTLSPSATTAQYPDNSFFTNPSSRTLGYLGRSLTGPNAWNRTNENGIAMIPLYTDRVDTASLPNAESFGNYHQALTFVHPTTSVTYTTSGGVNFDAYPAVDAGSNTEPVTVPFSTLLVRTGPDLTLRQSDYTGTMRVIQNQPFTVYALIYNQGQTTATDVSVAAYLNGDRGSQVGRRDALTVDPETVVPFLNVSIPVSGINTLGPATLMLVVDPDNQINEQGAAQEANNFANITLDVQPPPDGFVAILTPAPGQVVEPGSAMIVTGYVRDTNSVGIVGVPLTIELRSGSSVIATNTTTSGGVSGYFEGTINVPANTPDGSYTLSVTPSPGPIVPDSRSITIRKSVGILNLPIPLLGLPMWLLLLIIVIVVVLAVGVNLYMKVYGLGKMVECGECGSFIPEHSTACPKCGVEFEREMAKCSNCQAWIPVDVKECPECGVEFATGKVEMADYQQKMRMQYDEVVQKFRNEASRQLGRSLTEAEFQQWWRSQATFVTFEDWLREEEEMRKTGSKPCPVCTTLNSVTATVCHKCGSLLREQRPPGGGGRPVRRAEAPAAEGGAPTAPVEPVPRKVIQKPGPTRILGRKRAGGGEEGSGGSSSDDNTSVEDI